jgi:hypothetical protein
MGPGISAQRILNFQRGDEMGQKHLSKPLIIWERHLHQIRYILAGFFILPIFLMTDCSPISNQKATTQGSHPTPTGFLTSTLSLQKLRITNQSAYTIHDLFVRFPDEWVEFGDVLPGETTDYRVVSSGVYRYSGYKIQLDGQDYQQVPYDFLGESPMIGNAFTYFLILDPIRRTDPVQKTGIEVIQLVQVRQDQ